MTGRGEEMNCRVAGHISESEGHLPLPDRENIGPHDRGPPQGHTIESVGPCQDLVILNDPCQESTVATVPAITQQDSSTSQRDPMATTDAIVQTTSDQNILLQETTDTLYLSQDRDTRRTIIAGTRGHLLDTQDLRPEEDLRQRERRISGVGG